MTNMIWDEYKKFCKECKRNISKAFNKFGFIRSSIELMAISLQWIVMSTLYLTFLSYLLVIKILWGLVKFCFYTILDYAHERRHPGTMRSSWQSGGAISNMRGEEFEKYIARRLKEKGYYNVQLTPVSNDYGVDILAERDGVRYAFQCKRYASPVGVKAVQEVYAGCQKYGMEQPVVVTNSSYTPNAKTLASDLGVSLWDLEMFDAIF